jgi:hypothetical protein
MYSLTNSPRRVESRAALTRSAPTNLILRLSHTSFAVFFADTCMRMSSDSTPRSCALAALFFFASTAAPYAGDTASQMPAASRFASTLIAQMV